MPARTEPIVNSFIDGLEKYTILPFHSFTGPAIQFSVDPEFPVPSNQDLSLSNLAPQYYLTDI